MCLSWLNKTKGLSFKAWKKAINNIYKDWGRYLKINISGGEVLLPGTMKKTIAYSVRKLPYTGITSNGFLVNKKVARWLISKNFSNINISFDGYTKKTVNLIRGRPFAYDKTRSAIKYLVDEKKRQKSKTRIVVKTIIMGLNYKELPNLVGWVKDIGADGIYFQPIQPIYDSKQTFNQLKKSSLWIRQNNRKKAAKVINELIKMKRLNYPILNDYDNLKLVKEYFEINPKKNSKKIHSCFIDLESIFIFDDGKVYFCPSFPSIGNIKNRSLNNIINSDVACRQRSLIRSCKKINSCLSTCVSRKSLLQQLKLFLFLR